MDTRAGDNVWMIDLDTSFHMNPKKDWFSKYENYDGGKVYLGDDSFLDIVGHGSIHVKFIDGRVRQFDGVLYIPRLAKNLLFVSKLIDAGVHV